MKKLSLILTGTLCVLSLSSFADISTAIEKDSQYAPILNQLFSFFDRNAYDTKNGVYWSEVDNDGNPVSNKVYNVALSRMIYGLAYSHQLAPENLPRAKKLAQFQLNHLVVSHNKDTALPYFKSFVEVGLKDTTVNTPDAVDIWQQSYGLNGLSELYRQTKEPTLLSKIHRLHDAFVSRFHDPNNGGFWADVPLNGKAKPSRKSLQSLMYPLTAYMLNLWQADKIHGHKYQEHIVENIELLYQYGWNTETAWVNVNFDKDWQLSGSNNRVLAGHNFQLAALLQRAAELPFVDVSQSQRWRKRAQVIVDKTMTKPIFSDKTKASFYSAYNLEDNSVIDSRKAWWQHAEAVIALSLDKRYPDELNNIKTFFLQHFIDRSKGGEFFYLDQDNHPQTEELKGSIGKSAYHTTEMFRYLTKLDSDNNQ